MIRGVDTRWLVWNRDCLRIEVGVEIEVEVEAEIGIRWDSGSTHTARDKRILTDGCTVAKVHRRLLCFPEASGQAPHSRFVPSTCDDRGLANNTPAWVDTVKTSCSNELPPQDPDWCAFPPAISCGYI